MFNYTNLVIHYDFLFNELADPRTNNWFLIRHPIHGLLILSLYLYFVISWGPNFMKNRKPWKLNKTLIVYNFLQVLLSAYIFFEALNVGWLHYSWICEPVDYSNNPLALKVARLVHIYFIAKMTELLDTVFFVLRKKNNQVSFLHVYHHTVMPIMSWGVTKYFAGGHATFIGLINSFVHIIMYTYYMFAAMGPQYQKYLWWKKYLTTIQLVQFCVAFLHSSQLFFVDCGYPKFTLCFTLSNATILFYLFSDFYKIAYSSNQDNMTHLPKKHIESDSCNNYMSKSDDSDENVTNGEIHIKSH